MIQTERIAMNNKECIKTYSDSGYLIERDGVQYEEAVDPVNSGREYTETDISIEKDVEATVEDYQEALARLGVDLHEEENVEI